MMVEYPGEYHIKMKKRPVTVGTSRKRICPLSDPSVGIVSENDHKVGLCLCRYCDCNEHKCPVLDKHDIYLKSAFKSSYMQDFKQSRFDSPLKMQPQLFRPNMQKMDFQTTSQATYKPIKISPPKKPEKPIDSNIATFRGYSQYANDFPNWGDSRITHEKRWYPPVRSTEIPFVGRSSYKETFRDEKQQGTSINIDGRQLSASKSTISFGPKEKFDGATTYGRNMRDYSQNSLNYKVVVNHEKISEVKVTENHFKTTTNSFYAKNREPHHDPRLYRLALANRSVSVGKKRLTQNRTKKQTDHRLKL